MVFFYPIFVCFVIDNITRLIPDKVSWCISFEKDVVLIGKTRIVINVKLEMWCARIKDSKTRARTKHMEYKFNNRGRWVKN